VLGTRHAAPVGVCHWSARRTSMPVDEHQQAARLTYLTIWTTTLLRRRVMTLDTTRARTLDVCRRFRHLTSPTITRRPLALCRYRHAIALGPKLVACTRTELNYALPFTNWSSRYPVWTVLLEIGISLHVLRTKRLSLITKGVRFAKSNWSDEQIKRGMA